jgi:hypothetical protein
VEGGDLLGPYGRACALAEAKARVAGVENPISAFHRLGDKLNAAFRPQPVAGSTHSLVQITPLPRTVSVCFERDNDETSRKGFATQEGQGPA